MCYHWGMGGSNRMTNSMNHRMCKNRGMCYHWGMGDSNRMTNSMNHRVSNIMDSSGTMETVRSISHGSYTSTKSLGLSGASEFSLERFRNRLVRNLTSWSC